MRLCFTLNVLGVPEAAVSLAFDFLSRLLILGLVGHGLDAGREEGRAVADLQVMLFERGRQSDAPDVLLFARLVGERDEGHGVRPFAVAIGGGADVGDLAGDAVRIVLARRGLLVSAVGGFGIGGEGGTVCPLDSTLPDHLRPAVGFLLILLRGAVALNL